MDNPPPENPPPGSPWPPPPGSPWPPPPVAQGQYPRPYGVPPPDNTLGGLIPVRNASALTAYYLGVFSLIPCLGFFLGIAAFVLGLKGLAFAKANPEVKGKTHAWVGIIVGGLCALAHVILIGWFAVMSHTSRG